jgi:Zn-dependent protease
VRFEWRASALGALLLLTLGFAAQVDWGDALVAGALVFVSLLLHELAHVAAVSRHGVRVLAIGFTFKGAYTRREHSHRWIVEAQSALSGPAVNLVLAIIFEALPGKANSLVATSNLIIGVMNLLPIPPLDGWRFFKALLDSDRTAPSAA